MYHISYNTPCEIQGHIIFKKNPAYYGLGQYYDDKGTLWDIAGIYGNRFVQAVPVAGEYFSTASWDLNKGYSMRWKPYTYEYITSK